MCACVYMCKHVPKYGHVCVHVTVHASLCVYVCCVVLYLMEHCSGENRKNEEAYRQVT